MEEINTGKTTIKAIHLPGHTAGHYGFYFEQENILFTGDIDLVRTGPWYNSNSGNVGDLIASVQRIKEINPLIIVPSHRRIQTENIPAQLDAYVQVVLDRKLKYMPIYSSSQHCRLADPAYLSPKNIMKILGEDNLRNHLQQSWRWSSYGNRTRHIFYTRLKDSLLSVIL